MEFGGSDSDRGLPAIGAFYILSKVVGHKENGGIAENSRAFWDGNSIGFGS
jgi:hypothetical protein